LAAFVQTTLVAKSPTLYELNLTKIVTYVNDEQNLVKFLCATVTSNAFSIFLQKQNEC